MLISVGKYCAASSSTPVVKAGNSLISIVLFKTKGSLSDKFKVCLGITWKVKKNNMPTFLNKLYIYSNIKPTNNFFTNNTLFSICL